MTPRATATLILGAAAVAVLAPLWPSLLLAAWVADLVQPMVRWFERALGGRRRAAGTMTVLVIVLVLAPVAGLLAIAASSARDIVDQIGALLTQRRGVASLLGLADGAATLDLRAMVALAEQHGADALRTVTQVVSASARAAMGAVVFVATLYSLSTSRGGVYRWLLLHVPLERRDVRRLVGAFRETGRGLLLGSGGTALAQGLVATLVYAFLGVHRAATFGLLTGLCSFVPGVGTMLVWAPLAAGLALSGHPWRAAILVALGVGVIGTIDNLLRPWLARFGRLQMPLVIVFFSMIGGLYLLGAWGILVGPLVLRLALEAFALGQPSRADRRNVGGHARRAKEPAPRAE